MVVIMYKYIYCKCWLFCNLVYNVTYVISVRFKIISLIADYFQKNTFSVSLKAVLGVSINSFNEALFAQ